MIGRPELRLGNLELVNPNSGDEFWFDVYGDGFSLGKPIPITESIDTLLQDGSKVVTTGHDNREISFYVVISGADMMALADGETALFLECQKPSTLIYTPADGYGPATRFEVWAADLEPNYDDRLEVRKLQRAYKLTLICEPFGGSLEEITTVGVTSGATPTTTIVNDCSSATNWQAYAVYGGTAPFTPTISGGAIDLSAQADTTGGWVPPTLVYTPASPVDMSTTSFFAVDWKVTGVAASSAPRVWADGLELALLSTLAVPGAGYNRSLYLCSDASVASFRIGMMGVAPSGTSYFGDYLIDQILRTNQAPSTSTLRQKVTTVPIKGSARTQATLKVEHATSALGYTMVYTCPDLVDGYTPDLRRWLTSSGFVTTDASLVSGARHVWNGGTSAVYTVPLRILRPGPYLFMARVRRTTGTGRAVLNGTSVNFPATNVWQMAAIGVYEVGDHLANTAFPYTITLASGTDTDKVEIDEGWFFYVGDDAALTRIDLGTSAPSVSGSSNRLFLKTPSTERPYPSLWRGTLADESDSRNAVTDADAWGDHQAAPSSLTVFTVTPNALDAQVSATSRPRWFTHAGSLT